jgi:hypothetical protein
MVTRLGLPCLDIIKLIIMDSLKGVKKGVLAIFGLFTVKLVLEKAWAVKRTLTLVS